MRGLGITTVFYHNVILGADFAAQHYYVASSRQSSPHGLFWKLMRIRVCWARTASQFFLDGVVYGRVAGLQCTKIQASVDREQKRFEMQDTRIGELQPQLDEAVEKRNECATQMDALRVELRDLSTQLAEQVEANGMDLTGGTTFVDNTKAAGCSQPTSANGRTASLVTPDLVQHLAAHLVPMVSHVVIPVLTAQSMTMPTANLLTLENKCPPTTIVAQQRDPQMQKPQAVAEPLRSSMVQCS